MTIEFQAGKRTNMDGVMVRRILRKHGYPPDKQERATQQGFEAMNQALKTRAERGGSG